MNTCPTRRALVEVGDPDDARSIEVAVLYLAMYSLDATALRTVRSLTHHLQAGKPRG